jgi:hypothetical protein
MITKDNLRNNTPTFYPVLFLTLFFPCFILLQVLSKTLFKNDYMTNRCNKSKPVLKEPSLEYVPTHQGTENGEIDMSLLEDILHLTSWERMLANDDALNSAESLRVALKRRHAKSK